MNKDRIIFGQLLKQEASYSTSSPHIDKKTSKYMDNPYNETKEITQTDTLFDEKAGDFKLKKNTRKKKFGADPGKMDIKAPKFNAKGKMKVQ